MPLSEPAVKTKHIHTQAFERKQRGRNIRAGQKLAVFIENHGDNNRQIAVFFGGEHRRFNLVQVAHGFNQHQIGACFCPGDDLFFVKLISFIEFQFAGGF